MRVAGEACAGGCQVWDAITSATQPFIGNERSHYILPEPGVGSGGAPKAHAQPWTAPRYHLHCTRHRFQP